MGAPKLTRFRGKNMPEVRSPCQRNFTRRPYVTCCKFPNFFFRGAGKALLAAALWAAWDLSTRMRMLAADMRRATSLNLGSIRTRGTSSRIREVQAISRDRRCLRPVTGEADGSLNPAQHEPRLTWRESTWLKSAEAKAISFSNPAALQFPGDRCHRFKRQRFLQYCSDLRMN